MNYPIIDPEIFSIGPLSFRWYGAMYLLAFLICYLLGLQQSRTSKREWDKEQIYDLIFYGVIGAIVGGRTGFVLFYSFDLLLRDPLWLFRIWEGGMSFHGGLLGVIVSMYIFSRRRNLRFLVISDFVAPLIPIGLGLGRIGNFINSELPGRVTESFLGVHFPCTSVAPFNPACFTTYETVTRHVSSLYQAAAEGILLFVIVWVFSAHAKRLGSVSGMFLTAYGVLRFTTEFFREPDPGLGFSALGFLTMGQLLSIPMVVVGIFLLTPFMDEYLDRGCEKRT